MAKCKYMNKEQCKKYNLDQYPNFHKSGSIKGMKKLYYGEDALLVRSGSYIYKVPKFVYDAAY